MRICSKSRVGLWRFVCLSPYFCVSDLEILLEKKIVSFPPFWNQNSGKSAKVIGRSCSIFQIFRISSHRSCLFLTSNPIQPRILVWDLNNFKLTYRCDSLYSYSACLLCHAYCGLHPQSLGGLNEVPSCGDCSTSSVKTSAALCEFCVNLGKISARCKRLRRCVLWNAVAVVKILKKR